MDYISHGLWSYIFFYKIKRPFYAVIFGLLPDSVSWLIYFFYRLLSGGMPRRPIVAEIPAWVFLLYDISHSLIVAAIIISIIFLIWKKVPLYIFAWPIAIVIDVFTHTREFLPTPFLWPLSDWKFPGISWGTKWFVIINYMLIVVLLFLINYEKKIKKK